MRVAIKEAALAPAQTLGMEVTQSFRFDSDFVGFSGHFPEYPILPAVLQVLLAQLLAEQAFDLPLTVVSLIRAKFVQQLRPNDQIDVCINCQDKDGSLHCRSELQVEGQRAASFTLVLTRGSGQ